MVPMELNKLGNGNSGVAPASEWKKLASIVRNRKTTMFASGFAFTLFVCTIFLAFNNPNKLVTNPMDQGRSWFPSMLSNSSRSRSFINFLFPSSNSSGKTDTSPQDPQKDHESAVDNMNRVPEDSLKNKDTDTSNTQEIPFNDSVATNSTVPEGGLENKGMDTTSTHGTPLNASVPVKDVASNPQRDSESVLNMTSSSASTLDKPLEVVSSNLTVTPDLGSNITVSKGVEVSNRSNITEPKGVEISNAPSETVEKKCDIFSGRWVPDDTKPLYPAGSCPLIDESFNCFRNRRPDNDYERWRWQPNDCDIPRFNATDMLERLRGKRLSFVGDSLNRNMWESLVCSLRHAVANKSRVYEISGRKQFRAEGFYAFRYEDYNCSVEFVRAPFLVQEWEVDEGNGTKKETLRLDVMDSSAPKYKKADIIIFNTGHWWTHEKTSKGKDYYQEGNRVYPNLKVLEAYRKALKTWGKWVDKKINPNRTLVFFRGYSGTHFSGGQWNSGGQCHKESEPIYNETYLTKYNPKMKALESVIQEMRTPVMYLNITRMTDYRKDAHPSVYRKQYLSQEDRIQEVKYQDCSHWCLPGVPDTWNELLYASLLMTGKGVWTTP